jgi:hypothetical protein
MEIQSLTLMEMLWEWSIHRELLYHLLFYSSVFTCGGIIGMFFFSFRGYLSAAKLIFPTVFDCLWESNYVYYLIQSNKTRNNCDIILIYHVDKFRRLYILLFCS